MGKPLTEEQKRHVSEKMKLYWVKKKATAQGYQESPIVGVAPRSTRAQLRAEKKRRPQPAPPIIETAPAQPPSANAPDPWESLPFDQALGDLMDLKKKVRHAETVLSRRSASLPKVWMCWTSVHRKDQSNLPGMSSAYTQCAKDVPDGKWVFKDDCVKHPETGMIDPVVCCSNICYQLYQTYRSRLRSRERLENASAAQ